MTNKVQVLDRSCVLIVEDQYYIALELKRLVTELGGKALGPVSAVAAALALLEQSPDLALLDVNLNGERVYALAETLRARGIPFLFVTGYESWALDPRFAGTQMVCKPVTVAALAAAILRLKGLDMKGDEP